MIRAETLIDKYIKGIDPNSISLSLKNRINEIFSKSTLNGTYKFERINDGLNSILSILKRYGIVEAEIVTEDLFEEDSDEKIVEIAFAHHKDPYTPIIIENSNLIIESRKSTTISYGRSIPCFLIKAYLT